MHVPNALARKNLLVYFLFLAVLFNACYNLPNFPAYFWDEGVYIDRAIDFAATLQVYHDPTYIDHPPLGWIIPSAVFSSIDFPNSIVGRGPPGPEPELVQQITLLFLVPRLVGVAFTLTAAIMVYKISLIMYGDVMAARLSLVSFCLIPAAWPFRNMLLDPIMISFVLLSLFLLVSKNREGGKGNAASPGRPAATLLISGLFFGAAMLVKLTAIFFLPALLLFATGRSLGKISRTSFPTPEGATTRHVRSQKVACAVIWLAPVLACLAAWIAYFLVVQHTLHYLIETQLWQIGRKSFAMPGFALFLLLTESPLASIFGIAGLAMILIIRHMRRWSALGLPYLAFLFRGGYVGWVHIIPVLPILSIYAGKPLLLSAQYLSKRLQGHRQFQLNYVLNLTVISAALISIAITVWLGSFDEAKSDQQATVFLISHLPESATLVTDPGYGWVVKLYRPDEKVMDYYQLENMQKPPAVFYIAENSYPSKLDPSLHPIDHFYDKSCLVKRFQNSPHDAFHPYQLVKDRWWNVDVRYYGPGGCSARLHR